MGMLDILTNSRAHNNWNVIEKYNRENTAIPIKYCITTNTLNAPMNIFMISPNGEWIE